MPKPSLSPSTFKQGGTGFGVEAGNYEVVSASFKNHKGNFADSVNSLHLALGLELLDKDGERVLGADPTELLLSFGNKSLEEFHPGKGTSPQDTEPEDLGDAIDIEGNTVFGDGKFNQSSGACVFMTTLAKAGFPDEVLHQCWAPSYVGLKFAFASMDAKSANERFGLRCNTKPFTTTKGETVGATAKVVDKWLNPTYLSNGNGNGAGGKKAAGAAAKEEAKFESAEDAAKAVLVLLAKQKPGKKNTIKFPTALKSFATNAFMKAKMKPETLLSEMQKQIADEAWLEDALVELGASLADGAVTFPEAED